MKTGWAITAVGIAVMIAGIILFGRYVLATENWLAIVTTLAGLFLVGLGVRGARGVAAIRSTLFAAGVFLLLLSAYALWRVNWTISTAPEIFLLAAAGAALVVIGIRDRRNRAVSGSVV